MSGDIFQEASGSADAFTEMTDAKPRSTFKRENYWDKTDIEVLNIDVTKLKRTGKSFAVFVYPENDIPEAAAATLNTIAKALMSKGYTFRRTGDKNNDLHNRICKNEDAVVTAYLPWKKFNTDYTDSVLSSDVGYRISIGIHKAYMKLPPAVRAILASSVDAIYGKDATDPVDFILAWTDGGDEALGRNADFKKIGNNSFILQAAKPGNIPVFNVFNANFIDRIKEVIK